VVGFSDGPAEVHRVTLSQQVLREYKPSAGMWPSEHIPGRLAAALSEFGGVTELPA
jgi:acyl-CoA dehydrogenase